MIINKAYIEDEGHANNITSNLSTHSRMKCDKKQKKLP